MEHLPPEAIPSCPRREEWFGLIEPHLYGPSPVVPVLAWLVIGVLCGTGAIPGRAKTRN